MQHNASFLTMPEHPCMIARLIDQLQEASRDCLEDPRAFLAGALKENIGGGRRKTLLQVGFAIAILLYAVAFVLMLVFWSVAHQRSRAAQTVDHPRVMISLPPDWLKVDMPEGAEKSAGGGGGGQHTLVEPSRGEPPLSSLTPLVMAPRPEPTLTPPVLPIIESMMVDPRIQFRRDDLSPTGLPDSGTLAPTAGPGSGGGIGTGSDGGIGVGAGPGIGPGSGGNAGGNERNLSVGRPNSTLHQPAVDERPILLNQPRPLFTEEARKNKVQGVVRVRIRVDTNGAVREVVLIRGLPDGLSEQAIRAAYQMHFRPAMKNGRPVSYWLSNVEIEFNLR
jgi:periplasmic protein TonB